MSLDTHTVQDRLDPTSIWRKSPRRTCGAAWARSRSRTCSKRTWTAWLRSAFLQPCTEQYGVVQWQARWTVTRGSRGLRPPAAAGRAAAACTSSRPSTRPPPATPAASEPRQMPQPPRGAGTPAGSGILKAAGRRRCCGWSRWAPHSATNHESWVLIHTSSQCDRRTTPVRQVPPQATHRGAAHARNHRHATGQHALSECQAPRGPHADSNWLNLPYARCM